jgi:uncharacterized protein with PIN domain
VCVAKCRAADNRPLRFLCDEMLSGLARWLRIAGYDAAMVEPGLPDRLILDQAIAERRTMLTGDRRIMQMRGTRGHVLVLSGNGIDACARELTDQLGVDWHFDPFSRCVLCNLPLDSADDSERARLPPAVRQRPGLVNICPGCRRLYWEGSHVERMQSRLARFSRTREHEISGRASRCCQTFVTFRAYDDGHARAETAKAR